MKTDFRGLTSEQAHKNQLRYGFNELAKGKKTSMFKILVAQFKDVLTLTLSTLDLEKVSELCAGFAGRMTMRMGEKVELVVRLRKNEDVLRLASKVVEEFEKLLRPAQEEK